MLKNPIPSTGGRNVAKSERRFCARVPGRTSRRHFRMLRCSLLCNVPSADPDIQNRASTIEIALQQSKSRFNIRHRNSMCWNRISTCKKGISTCEKRIQMCGKVISGCGKRISGCGKQISHSETSSQHSETPKWYNFTTQTVRISD